MGNIRNNLGWWLIGVFTVIPVVYWFQLNGIGSSFENGFAFWSMVGRLSGLIGIVWYAANFLLATRLKWLEGLFGGLNRVYIAHHVLGGLALIALIIHPLALAMRYVPDEMRRAAEFLLPQFSGNIDWAINYGFVAFFGLVFLLILTFFIKLRYQLWLFTHKFLGLAFLFGGLHAMNIQSDTTRDNFLRYYILVWIAVGIASFIYRTLLPRIFVRRYSYSVEGVTSPADNVFEIQMSARNKLMNYKPGQFIFVKFDQKGFSKEWHPFSISSAPAGGTLTITAKALGDYTSTLGSLQPGTPAQVEGAFGRFTNTLYKQPKQLWIAGGIGVTPFLSMAKSIVKKDTDKEITMFYVVNTESELIDYKGLSQLSSFPERNFRLLPYISDQQEGYISAEHIISQVGSLNATDIFICGPPGMMNSLKKQFTAAGVPKRSIHTEEFSIQ